MKKSQQLRFFLSDNLDFLAQASLNRENPFRNCILATTDPAHCSTLRTVVVRKVGVANRELDFFTDYRSTKIQHLGRNPNISLLFYHPEKLLQIRMKATAEVHWKNEVTTTAWNELPIKSRKDYCAIDPPGALLPTPGNGLPANWTENPDQEMTEYGFQHFALVRCTFHHVDLLQLSSNGHLRANYEWTGREWMGQWVVP